MGFQGMRSSNLSSFYLLTFSHHCTHSFLRLIPKTALRSQGLVNLHEYACVCLSVRRRPLSPSHPPSTGSSTPVVWHGELEVVCLRREHTYLWISIALKWSEVAQSCPTLCNPVDCSPPGSSIHGILQARILEWVAIAFSRGSSQPRDWTQVSRIAGRRFNLWATREAQH